VLVSATDGVGTKAMVAMLREAGAVEIHMRISSPPYEWPCFYGMDTGTRGELLAANMDTSEIQAYLNVDSLAYLQLDRLVAATGAPTAGFCTACLTGEYPVEIPIRLRSAVIGPDDAPREMSANPLVEESETLLPSEHAARIRAL
jgi:amidophosphoribosyltransferase